MRCTVLFTFYLLLSGCSSEDVETANFGSDYLYSSYDFINVYSDDVNFHMRNSEVNGDARDASHQEYLKATVSSGGINRNNSHELNAGRRVSIYVESPYQNQKRDRIHVEHDYDKKYVVIAWPHDSSLRVTSVRKKSANKQSVMRVRLFATEDIEYSVAGNKHILERGNVSDYFDVTDCDGDLAVNDKTLHICDGDYGYSYLLIASGTERLGLYRQD